MSLYTLTTDLKELEEQISLLALADDPQSEEMKAQAAMVEETIKNLIQDKSVGILKLVRNWNSELSELKDEIERLKEEKEKKEKKIERLKDYLKICIENAGITKVQTALGNISIRKGAGKVNILKGELIPEEFKREVVKIEYDKNSIKAKLKDGEVVEGAELIVENSLVLPKAPKEK